MRMRKISHIRMVPKHLCLSGMLGLIQSKITDFEDIFFFLVMFYVFNFSKFDVKSIIFFPILAKGLFPKLLEKALMYEHHTFR